MDFSKAKKNLERNGFEVHVFKTGRAAKAYLDGELDGIFAELLLQGIHEALGGGVKRGVLNQLADTDIVGGRSESGGAQAENQDSHQNECKDLFHLGFLL